MTKPTPGPYVRLYDRGLYMSGAKDRLVATFGNSRANLENKANFELVKTALNACHAINPDNPMAVAENIERAYRACSASHAMFASILGCADSTHKQVLLDADSIGLVRDIHAALTPLTAIKETTND